MTAPYRMVAALDRRDGTRGFATWRPTGRELGAARALPPEVPGTLVLEALVQCAGLLLGDGGGVTGAPWLLGGVESADFGRLGWGVEAELACEVVLRSGRAATLTISASTPDGVACEARILMVRLAAPGPTSVSGHGAPEGAPGRDRGAG